MNTISLDGLGSNSLVKEIGIYGAIIGFAIVLVLGIGRATGLITAVGYQWGHGASSGLWGTSRDPYSIMTPVYLQQGEELVGYYDASIHAGQIRLFVRKGFIPAPFMRKFKGYHYVKQSGSGEYVFRAPEAGIYWPDSRISSGNLSQNCKKKMRKTSFLKQMTMPDFECPGSAAKYSVFWSTR